MDRWTGSILGLVLIAAVCSAVSGCDGPPREVRVAAAETAGGIDLADRLLDQRLQARTREVLAELVVLRDDGRIADAESGLAWYDAQLQPERLAVRVLEAAAASLRALEAAAGAWAAGAANGPQAFSEAVSCSVAAIAEVPAVLEAVGVEVPELVMTWAPVVASYAVSGCPEPEVE